MICISIAAESRRLALVDMLNAAKQCDLLEIRLDRFGKIPDVSELLAHKPKPVIFSCRRPCDGGQWQGSEEARLTLLRQCIVGKADYVEIELDSADQIRKFPPAKRVISYTNLGETPPEIADIYAQALTKNPDVIKLVTPASTPEEAWPLVQILGKPAVPTVIVGLGKPGIMLTVLGKKIGAPWTYAALEKGMEAYPGQPTVRDLEQIYHYRSIERSTRLLGVTGFDECQSVSVATLNAAFAHLDVAVRCLPVGIGSVSVFRRIMDAVHMIGVVVDEEHAGALSKVAAELDEEAQHAEAVDLLCRKEKSWKGYRTLAAAGLAALEAGLEEKKGTQLVSQSATETSCVPFFGPLKGRMVMLVGATPIARLLARRIKERGGVPIVASHNRTLAQQLAQELECRYVLFEALYSTMHDVLIVCDEEKEHTRAKAGSKETGVHAGYLKQGMTVMDLTSPVRPSPLLLEAKARGCKAILPRLVFREQLLQQVHKITGKSVPPLVLDQALDKELEEGS